MTAPRARWIRASAWLLSQPMSIELAERALPVWRCTRCCDVQWVSESEETSCPHCFMAGETAPCLLFWVLAAIDGHAKNFSLSLRAGGRFRLTPLYDIMSAYPLVARRALERRELKMAMAVVGKSRHDRWSEIQARHWLSTARVCRLPASEVHTAFELFCSNFETAVEQVAARLPAGFPDAVADPIFEGLRAAQMGLAGALRELR
jgi:hypothetical protein